MIPEYSRKSLAIGIPGLVLQILCYEMPDFLWARSSYGLSGMPLWAAIASSAGITVSTILLIIGLGYYAKSKGYTGALGLLGLLSCVGLIIVAVLPDKTKK
jgi:4-amino-4-deoxy-L-arabinose transferase-like glycosyltransferase